MPIHYIANDPASTDGSGSSVTEVKPSKDRKPDACGFEIADLPAEQPYGPASPEFVAWQAREGALRALDAFEDAYGPLPGWRGRASHRLLALVPLAGEELNAYYDRASISFFVSTVNGAPVYSGASADVVAHEAGHAILDAIRPDLFGANLMEVGAFHEGFGDCIAILAALADRTQGEALLKQGLRKENFVESLAEQLSEAIRVVAPAGHNAGAPRHSFNTFQWAFPSSLPIDGRPGVLINEEHSLGQLPAGVFYDLVCHLYDAGGTTGPDALWKAAKTAMKLTARAVEGAPIKPRFFEAWGRAMMVIDAEEFGGKHAAAIRMAFDAHGIAAGASNFLSPRARLSTTRRRASQSAKTLVTPKTKSFVRVALGLAAGARLESRSLNFGTQHVVEVAGSRDVDLTGVSERLANVIAPVPQQALVGDVDDGPALLGAIDTGFTYDAEVRDFAASLVARGAIAFDGKRGSRRGAAMVASAGIPTHRVATERGQRVLKRIAFACGCKLHTESGS